MESQERTAVRSLAAKKLGFDFDSCDIKSQRNYEKSVGCWPHSNSFCQRLVKKRFPYITTNPKQYRQAEQLAALIYLHHRMCLSAEETAAALGLTTKAVERRSERINKMAIRLIIEQRLTAENGESFLPSRSRRTSRGRVLVSSFQVVTSDPRSLGWLATHHDKRIADQAVKALAELRKNQESEFRLLLAA
jgi:hypothetical protein